MYQTASDSISQIVQQTFLDFVAGIRAAVPNVLGGIVFLVLAYAVISVALSLLRRSLDALYPEEQDLVVSLGVTVAGVFLWFGAGLAFFKIVGMGDVAASLGTATGFVALGVSYALSNMIADTVAGVYLLRDPDFNPGDRVVADPVTGVVTSIGLRKSRFRDDSDDVVVVANREVEKKWRRVESPDEGTPTEQTESSS
ncbi:mechanosensitive ion channel domain-containing protein [Halogeometricum limi]|uniref:Mechanosensitive ion channel n=1 Tax=Halogeometricum limi TaxID=555875 RepID=A0A1I6FTA4_9EURY|nr:mechanosensitive ion channel domain-containing protein [Halogeometricum limi]SFR33037.1 Mechanosensitive ion channel [Halogeometricum limi]